MEISASISASNLNAEWKSPMGVKVKVVSRKVFIESSPEMGMGIDITGLKVGKGSI